MGVCSGSAGGRGDDSHALGINSGHDWVVVTVAITVSELKVGCAVLQGCACQHIIDSASI